MEKEIEVGFNNEGGRDDESKSWGKREIAGEGEANAELVDDDDPPRLDVSEGGVMIFVALAGRMSLLPCPFFLLQLSI